MYTTPIRSTTGNSQLRCHILPDVWVERLPEIAAEIEGSLSVKPPVRIFGKWTPQPRSVGLFSNEVEGYKYSGQTAKAIPMTTSLSELMQFVNNYFGANFNCILVNKYGDGNDYICAHSDDEAALDHAVGVVCLNVGAARKFRIRDKATRKIVSHVYTEADQMMQMWGDFQSEFLHEIVKEPAIKETRVSFTFRRIV
jgi:alkylated DNA repair dioxygenase AlkB